MKNLILILLLTILMMGCEASGDRDTIEITVSAAASLKDPLAEIVETYEQENLDVKITLNMAGSGTLAMQIENGAEVDLFISAADSWMNGLNEKGLIVSETVVPLLSTRMVIVVPETSKYNENDITTLFEDRTAKIVIGEPSSVPAGKYAMEWVESMGMTQTVNKQLVYGKDAKEVLSWVETGNADAGIVYFTDAIASKKVRVVRTSTLGDHTEVNYPAAVVKSSKHIDEAIAFLNYMIDSEVFETHGFTKIKREE
jgi:molybdate transport system substrate-binding protein